MRFGMLEAIDSRHFYPTLEAAIAAFYAELSQRRVVLINRLATQSNSIQLSMGTRSFR